VGVFVTCSFLGASDRKIFANLTLPRIDEGDVAVLLCYPFGQEYMRAHSAYRQLANLIARSGMPVMRFDYPGSGDSYGSGDTISFDECFDGALEAVEELKKVTGKKIVYVSGLRFGSIIAAKLGASVDYIKRVVLWDPFSNGGQCLADWVEQIGNSLANEGLWYVHGYPVSRGMREQLELLSIPDMSFGDDVSLIQVVSHDYEASRILESRGFRKSLVPSQSDWNYVDRDGSILMPAEMTKAVCSMLSERKIETKSD
jgi:hypothetical protein